MDSAEKSARQAEASADRQHDPRGRRHCRRPRGVPRPSEGPFLVVGLGNPGPGLRRQPAQRRRDGARRAGRAGRHPAVAGQGRPRARASPARAGWPAAASSWPGPLTYMNESGGPVRGLLDYHHLPVEDLVVVHDELDLPFAAVRLKRGGGEGGHNGLRSITRSTGTKDYLRVRVGIGRPPGRQDPADFVLKDFSVDRAQGARPAARRGGGRRRGCSSPGGWRRRRTRSTPAPERRAVRGRRTGRASRKGERSPSALTRW